jgi:hypothetical protein
VRDALERIPRGLIAHDTVEGRVRYGKVSGGTGQERGRGAISNLEAFRRYGNPGPTAIRYAGAGPESSAGAGGSAGIVQNAALRRSQVPDLSCGPDIYHATAFFAARGSRIDYRSTITRLQLGGDCLRLRCYSFPGVPMKICIAFLSPYVFSFNVEPFGIWYVTPSSGESYVSRSRTLPRIRNRHARERI